MLVVVAISFLRLAELLAFIFENVLIEHELVRRHVYLLISLTLFFDKSSITKKLT